MFDLYSREACVCVCGCLSVCVRVCLCMCVRAGVYTLLDCYISGRGVVQRFSYVLYLMRRSSVLINLTSYSRRCVEFRTYIK